MNYTRKILSLYAALTRRLVDLDRLNKRDCVYSYGVPLSVEGIFEKIMRRNEEKELLLSIKEKVELIFARLSDDDKNVLNYRYFNVLPKNGFGFTERTYYRKLQKAEKTFSEYLNFIGLGEKKMKEKFGRVKFIKNFFAIIKEDCSKKEYLKRKSKRKVGFSACKERDDFTPCGAELFDKQAS